MFFLGLWSGAPCQSPVPESTAEKSDHFRGSASPAIDFRPKLKYWIPSSQISHWGVHQHNYTLGVYCDVSWKLMILMGTYSENPWGSTVPSLFFTVAFGSLSFPLIRQHYIHCYMWVSDLWCFGGGTFLTLVYDQYRDEKCVFLLDSKQFKKKPLGIMMKTASDEKL